MKTIALHDDEYEMLRNLKFELKADNMRLAVVKLMKDYETSHKLEAPA
ncbi:MAG: hypothetical protein RE472_09750 [Thermoplasmatales archaeon]|jgi:hypothetical protein|nr:MAG: hypothetical protein RE472_09750 [Thermoplasmatales archaeon]